jgi:hypothetical protein
MTVNARARTKTTPPPMSHVAARGAGAATTPPSFESDDVGPPWATPPTGVSDPVVILPAETWDQRERERAEMVRLLRETVDEDSGLYVSIAITKFLSTLPSEEM